MPPRIDQIIELIEILRYDEGDPRLIDQIESINHDLNMDMLDGFHFPKFYIIFNNIECNAKNI